VAAAAAVKTWPAKPAHFFLVVQHGLFLEKETNIRLFLHQIHHPSKTLP
jgi:hypothetical protein